MARFSLAALGIKSPFGKSSINSQRRGQIRRCTVIEQLETRTLLAGFTFPWVQDVDFDQFTGGAPKVFGFGVTDKSLAGKDVDPNPHFIGLDTHGAVPLNWGVGFHDPFFDTFTGAAVHGSFSIKLGIAYGFYVNAGTANLYHDGAVNFGVAPSTQFNGVTEISSSVAADHGTVHTYSPTISAYATLVISFHLNVSITATVADDDLGELLINFDVDFSKDLFSINKQLKDANGNPATNPNGTPQLDGDIKYFVYQAIGAIQKAGDYLTKATNDTEKATADKSNAQKELAKASTPAEKAAAQQKMAAADTKIAKATADKADAKKKSGEKQEFGGGVGLVLKFQPTTFDTGTLGIQAKLQVGAKIGDGSGGVSVGHTLGTMAVSLPSIALNADADATGTITASTKSFPVGSQLDLNRNIFTISVDPMVLVGLGEYTISAGPLSAALTTVSYNILAALAVNQTVTSSLASYPVTMNFTDAETGQPMMVSAAVGGFMRDPATSITFPAGQQVLINPPASGHRIAVSTFMNPVYSFRNNIGLDLGVSGNLVVLGGYVGAALLGRKNFGPLYTHRNEIVDAQDLGTIYQKTFTVTSATPELLGTFVIGPSADVGVSLISGPPATIDYSPNDPNPPINYTVRITNHGPNDATGVVLSDVMPSQVQFDSFSSTAGISVAGLNGTYVIGNLAAGASVDVTFAGRYISGPAGSLASSFGVVADQADTDRSNNQFKQSSLLVGPTIYDVHSESELRSAIAQVNAAPDGTFTPIIYIQEQLFIHLTGGELQVSKSVTIRTRNGDQALLDGQGLSRIFNFTGDQQQTYRLEYLNLSNGNGGNSGFGGAISLGQGGTLTINDCTIHDNSALTGGGSGGAIYAAVGALVLERVEFSNNQAVRGGALALAGDMTTITDVKMNDNSATDKGGAIEQYSTGNHDAVTTIKDSSFFRNQGSTTGAAVDNAPGSARPSTVSYERSVFSTTAIGDSTAPPDFGGQTADGSPPIFISLGQNVVSDSTGNATDPTDRPDTQGGLFLSGPHQIGSGQIGFIIGGLSLVWPGVTGVVNFNLQQQDHFRIINGILQVQDEQSFDISTDHLAFVGIVALDEDNQGVGPNFTSFLLEVVMLNLPPTMITVDSMTGIDEATTAMDEPGTLIGSVTVADGNSDRDFTFNVDDARFQVIGDGNFGYNLYLRPGETLSHLTEPTIPIKITATDLGGLSFTSPFTVMVNKVLQAPTYINLVGTNVKPGMAGATVGQLETFSPNDDPNAPFMPGEYMYTVSDPRFEVVNDVLQLKAGQMVAKSTVPIPMQITSTNSAGLFLTQSFEITQQTPIILGISGDTGTNTGDGITTDRTLTLHGTADDNAPISVSFNGSVVGNTTATATGAWTFDYTNVSLPDGVYSATVVSGNTPETISNPSPVFAITVDNVAPTVGATANPTTAGLAEVYLTFSSPVDGLEIENLALTRGGVAVSLVDAFLSQNEAEANKWTVGALAGVTGQSGNYTLTISPTGITDTAGNALVAGSFNFFVAPSSVATPIVAGITTDTGASSSDGITNDPTLIVRGTAEPTRGITVSFNGTVVGTTTADGTGAWSFDRSAVTLADGIYSITAVASDGLGHNSNPSSGFLVTIDSAGPAVNATVTPPGVSFNQVQLTFDAVMVGFSLSSLSMARGGAAVSLAGATLTTSDGGMTWTLGGLASRTQQAGTYSVSINPAGITDTAGNALAADAPFNFVVAPSSVATPAVTGITTDTGSNTSDGITRDQALIVHGTSSPNLFISISFNGAIVGATTADGTGAWTFDYSAVTLADGGYAVTAFATDTGGNSSNTSSPFQITVKSAALSVNATVAAPSFSFNEVHITFNTAVTGFGLGSLSLTVGGIPVSLAGATLTTSDGGTNWTLGGLAAKTAALGTYALTVAPAGITDIAGNALPAAAPFGFSVVPHDITPPGIKFKTPAAFKVKGKKPYAITITYTDPSGIDLNSLGNANVRITGPVRFAVFATKYKVVASANGTSVAVTYRIAFPAGGWTSVRNGTYKITLFAHQVADSAGASLAVNKLVGSFKVAIA